MGIADIRKKYGITCKVGQRVRYSPPRLEPPRYGFIVGAQGDRLRIKLYPKLGQRQHVLLFHPTWCLEFLGE